MNCGERIAAREIGRGNRPQGWSNAERVAIQQVE
jgi:hypothetical protein